MLKSTTKPAPRANEIVTSLRLSPEQHEALKRISARENRSVSGQLRHMIEQLVAEQSETKAAA